MPKECPYHGYDLNFALMPINEYFKWECNLGHKQKASQIEKLFFQIKLIDENAR